jgi:Tfp pilus assembly protein PilV
MQTTTLILSVTCILAGTLLLLFSKGEAMAAVLVTAGVGGLSRVTQVATRERNEAREREQEAMETTQMLRDQLAKREAKK